MNSNCCFWSIIHLFYAFLRLFHLCMRLKWWWWCTTCRIVMTQNIFCIPFSFRLHGMVKTSAAFLSFRLSCSKHTAQHSHVSRNTHLQFNENIENLYFNTKMCVCPNKSGSFKTNVILEFANFRVKIFSSPFAAHTARYIYCKCDNTFFFVRFLLTTILWGGHQHGSSSYWW